MEKVEALLEFLPYVRAFQGKTFVVKLGGELLASEYIDNIAQQLVLIQAIGIRLVVVHGGGPQLGAMLRKLGIQSEVIEGRRITDEATLDAAKMVFAGQLLTDLVAALKKHGARALGLSGADAGLLEAERREPMTVTVGAGDSRTIDFQLVGNISHVRSDVLENLLAQRIVPVMCPLASDVGGQVLNVNADTIASKVAQSLMAEKIILMSNVRGVLRDVEDACSLISYMNAEEAERLIASRVIQGGMLPKVRACLEAVQGGVPRAHIIDGTRKSALLLELFSNDGVGTMIVR